MLSGDTHQVLAACAARPVAVRGGHCRVALEQILCHPLFVPNALVERIGRDFGWGQVLQLAGHCGGTTRFSSVDLTTTVARIKRSIRERKG